MVEAVEAVVEASVEAAMEGVGIAGAAVVVVVVVAASVGFVAVEVNRFVFGRRR